MQSGGGEGRRRVSAAFLFLHAFHHKRFVFHGVFQSLGRLGIGHHGLFAVDFCQIGLEGRGRGGGQQGLELPVLFGHKGLALFLAFHDKAQGHRLYPPGRNAAFDGFPQQGGNFIAHQTIQHAAGLLSLEQARIDGAGMFQSFFHRAGSDFVELDAFDIFGLVADNLGDVPGDGLALAVGVGRQIDGVGFGGGFTQGADDFFFTHDGFVTGREVAAFVHAYFFGGQIADMPHAGLHRVFVAQKFFYGLHLGR